MALFRATYSLLIWAAVSTCMKHVAGQNRESIRIPSNGDSCNVINLNIGRGDDNGGQMMGPQGPPGKRGSEGLPGIKGSKGQKGEVGPRGIPEEIDVSKIAAAVLKALAASSCSELMEDHGITENGYYQMRTNDTNFATYKYCEFEIHDAGNCEELRKTRSGVFIQGYYLLRRTNGFRYCSGLPPDCRHVVRSEAKTLLPSGGVFDIYSESWQKETAVTCDLITDGGGWTIFQRRIDGSVDFFRNWADYVNGFGNKEGEFWLGLEAIYQLTRDGNYELRVDLTDWSGNAAYAKYGVFSIASRDDNYRIQVGNFTGTAGDSLTRHNNQQFSTKDADHDSWTPGKSCAPRYKGGWWYAGCVNSNLNGPYNRGPGVGSTTGNGWYRWKNSWAFLKVTEMKFRKTN